MATSSSDSEPVDQGPGGGDPEHGAAAARDGATAGRSGGLAALCVRHPVGVSMLALSVVILGLFSLGRLGVDLLPHIIYPEVRVRIADPGVPGKIMEDQVTRQLEEQLAITEDAISVQSSTTEARSQVDLTFQYGKDIDIALRDASTRLDRAKRFLPDSIDPPVIYKLDPSQIPVLEFVASSNLRPPSELREWVDYRFSKWFLNLPGVAAVEVGGASQREVQVLPDQQRLAGFGLTVDDLIDALERGNLEQAGGRLRMARQEIAGRTTGRFETIESIAALPIPIDGGVVRLRDVAEVIDTEQDEQLRVRLDREPGVKLAFQKQPQANTVAVVDEIRARMAWLREQGLIPDDISLRGVSDGAVFVRQAINNAAVAAGSGAVLAMLVVFIFLGDLRRTLIIGSSIPLGIMVAFLLMDSIGLTLNVMTLGGIALGVGLLVDNTIVMLENIYRHQRMGKTVVDAASDAAREVNGAVVASTSTNLVAVLPFLFIGGLVGLLFQELIATISAATVASLLVALTLVPALGARVPAGKSRPGLFRRAVDGAVGLAQSAYALVLRGLIRIRWLVPVPFIAALFLFAIPQLDSGKQEFLPSTDDGNIRVFITADSGISLDEMDSIATRVEQLLLAKDEVETVFSQVGGFVFGRSTREATNLSRLSVQLVPRSQRKESAGQWIKRVNGEIRDLKMAGVKVRMRPVGIRGLRVGRGEDDVSIRIQGPDLDVLASIGDRVVRGLERVPALGNPRHSAEDSVQELTVNVDRERAAALGLTVDAVGRAVRIALQGVVATDFIDGDRSFDVRVRFPAAQRSSPRDIETIMLFPASSGRDTVYLGDVASVSLVNSPANIMRDRQQRIIEVSANVAEGSTLGEASAAAFQVMRSIDLPEGYSWYDGGASATLSKSEQTLQVLLALAVFLVFVVMAVQYESLRNPFIILLGVPFACIGVSLAVWHLDMALSMPMWLGMVMLAGIVVNNAIVLVEYIELERARGAALDEAIVNAGRLRLRPILMTTLTTVAGMSPLALGLGEGAEMLQPLAIVIVWGLSFSTVVSLVLIPVLYRILGRGEKRPLPVAGAAAAAAE